MAGRTVSKWFNFVIEDSVQTIRDVEVYTVSIVGVVYEEQDLTALADQVRGALPNMPSAPIEITGPFSNKAVTAPGGTGAAAAYTGCDTIFPGIVGAILPLTLDCQFGIQALWATNMPQFGISQSATSGYLCFEYTVDPGTMIYSAKFNLFPGSSLPAWGTGAEA